jgi:histidine triad (HIT) family protein
MDCIFCKIVAKEIPAEIIHEDDHVLAFLDIAPRAPGHAMVIPKVHAATILDLPDAEIKPLFSAVKKVSVKIEKAIAPDGFTIGVNHGDAAGQTVKHLHVHVIPRWKGDGEGSVHSVVNNPFEGSVSEMAKKIQGS